MIKIINLTYHRDLVELQKKKNLPLIKKHILPRKCFKPWKSINIDHAGRVFICDCDGWLPYPVGHLFDFQNIEEIFESQWAKKIQKSISDGTYNYCDTDACPVSNYESNCTRLDDKYTISIGIDDSCNLACPSCRYEIRFNNEIDVVQTKLLWINRIKTWIEKISKNTKVNICIGSNGEPFASPIYLNLLKNEFTESNVFYTIRTNGLLLKRELPDLNLLSKLELIEISIDAASKEVYEYVRQPGKWNNLVKNIDYLLELSQKHTFRMVGNFVIQRANLYDILPFIDWCQERGIQPNFTLLQHWTHFTNYDAECVHRPTDHLYQDFLKIIKTSKFQNLRYHGHPILNCPDLTKKT